MVCPGLDNQKCVHRGESDTFCKDPMTVKTKMKGYVRLLEDAFCDIKNFKICRVGIQCMTYFLESVCHQTQM